MTIRLALLHCLCAMLLAGTGGVAPAQVYRWVDKEGKVHYSENRPEPEQTRQLERKNLAPSVIPGGDSYELRQATANFPVTLYTAPNCEAACQAGRALLKRLGVPFTEKAVDTAAGQEAMKKAVGGNGTVPALLVGSKKALGFEETQWTGLLEAAGYPLRK